MALTEKHPHQLASFSWRIHQLPGMDWRTSPSNGTRHGRLPWDLVPATVIRWAPKKRYPAAGGCSRAPFTGGGFSDQIVAVRRLLVYTSSLAAAGMCDVSTGSTLNPFGSWFFLVCPVRVFKREMSQMIAKISSESWLCQLSRILLTSLFYFWDL